MRALSSSLPGSVLIAVVVSGLPGCGGSDAKIGAVSGKVTYRGQPVSEGVVSFIDAQAGAGAEATLRSDGTFTVETPEGGLPVGTYGVSVSPPVFLDSSDPRTPPVQVQKKVKDIPEKYRSHYSSGWSTTVNEGPNEVSLEMK